MKLLPGIQKNIPLKNYTTFKIGGRAKYFFQAKSKEELIKAIKFAQSAKLPFFILGGGSNLLVSDKGYNGLVIKCQMSNVKCQNKMSNVKIIEAETGAELGDLVKLAAKNNLTGLEWAAGIPGTVGGAVHNNVAAFDNSMADVVKSVEVFDVSESKIKNIEAKSCNFGYKETIFKKNKNLIILSCILQLKPGKAKEIEQEIKHFLDYREKNHPLKFPSAGCIFKNPSGVSAGELIEKCGLKGRKSGGAMISEKHANFIVNLDGAQAKDVLSLINLIKKEVKNKFNVELKEEIQYFNA